MPSKIPDYQLFILHNHRYYDTFEKLEKIIQAFNIEPSNFNTFNANKKIMHTHDPWHENIEFVNHLKKLGVIC